MRPTPWLLMLAALTLAGTADAQPKGPPQPPLIECGGTHSGVEIICGTHSPEDLELTPDGKSIIVSQFVNNRGAAGPGAGLTLFDPGKKSFTAIRVTAEPLKDWGDATCPGPIGEALAPHGISLLKRTDGKVELYVVNHGGRESIEMYELKSAAGGWSLTWHGCVVSTQGYNDVAALPDGGFFATHPTALQAQGADAFSGQPSGYVSRWTPGKGETEVAGTRTGYPNGVVASADGRYIYFNAFALREVHKYDVKAGKETSVVKVDFMPDNLSWTKKGHMLAAGVKGARGDCPAGSGKPCIQGFGVAEIDPAKMESKTVFDSEGKGALIAGVSIALEMGNAVYIGAFTGDRLVKLSGK